MNSEPSNTPLTSDSTNAFESFSKEVMELSTKNIKQKALKAEE